MKRKSIVDQAELTVLRGAAVDIDKHYAVNIARGIWVEYDSRTSLPTCVNVDTSFWQILGIDPRRTTIAGVAIFLLNPSIGTALPEVLKRVKPLKKWLGFYKKPRFYEVVPALQKKRGENFDWFIDVLKSGQS